MMHRISPNDMKKNRMKSNIGIVCISLSLFLLFVPLNFNTKFNVVLTSLSFCVPFISAIFFIFIIPRKPFLFLMIFYFITTISWFYLMSNINMNAKAEWYFFLLFFPFMILFIVGNFLYSKESDWFAYGLILLIAFFIFLEG